MAGGQARPGSVLVPAGDKMKSYACLRSLHPRGIHTVVASEYERVPLFSSKFCSERVDLSATPADLAAYKDELLTIAARPDVETIFPVRECDAFVLAKYEEAFDRHVSLVTPDVRTLRRAHDRLSLAREAAAAGVPRAETRLLSEVESWDSDVVVKSRYNLLTADYVTGYSREQARQERSVWFVPAGQRPDPDAIRAEMSHEPIVQNFVPEARKHLYCALWDHGEPVATYQHRQIRKNSWVGGGGVYRKSAHSEAVERAARDLLGHLDWDGFACIEYVKDAETGEWKFLEINPRIWQSMPEAVRAGADFPYYYLQATRGETDDIEGTYETGTPCHIAYGEVGHLLSVLRDDSPFVERPSFLGTAKDVVASCLKHPRFDYLRRDDPRLVLSAIRRTFGTGVTRSREYRRGDREVPRATPGDGNPSAPGTGADEETRRHSLQER